MKRDLLITGIPRSGTSLLCRLLHEQRNTIVINEPKEIIKPLANGADTAWLPGYYRDLRRKIQSAEPIENKFVQGRLVDDTTECNERAYYRPNIDNENFVLGTKNTLHYLTRLALIKSALPDAVVVACIRHPYDAVASWKRSFPHLLSIDFSLFPDGFLTNQALTNSDRARLRSIDVMKSPTKRRAALWTFLATLIANEAGDLVVVRYEDLVDRPMEQLTRIGRALNLSEGYAETAECLQQRSKRDVLNDEDYEAIAEACTDIVPEFNYELSTNL